MMIGLVEVELVVVLKGMTGRMDVRNGDDDDDTDYHGENQHRSSGYRRLHHYGMSMSMSMSRRRRRSTTATAASVRWRHVGAGRCEIFQPLLLLLLFCRVSAVPEFLVVVGDRSSSSVLIY